jgi:hypothetical protein
LTGDVPPFSLPGNVYSGAISSRLVVVKKGEGMALLSIGAKFPEVKLEDIDSNSVAFPASFVSALASIVFFYRGQW